MLYNVFMLVLTIVGVVGIVVYSYKMSRTRVYPVGIVRKPVTRPVAPSTAAKSLVVAEPKPDVTREFVTSWAAWAAKVDAKGGYVVRDVKKPPLRAFRIPQVKHHPPGSQEYTIVDHVDHVMPHPESVSWQSNWSCPKCGFVQKYRKEARCPKCSFALDANPNVTVGLETTKESVLQSQLSQQHQALKDMDKRIRELEKESITKKTAEIVREEEKRQDWVH